MQKNKVLLIVVFISLFSCKKENMGDCFKSTGKVIIEERALEPFSSLEVNNHMDVFVTYDSVYSIAVKAGENLQSLIRTEVANNKLTLKNDNKCNWVRSFKNRIEIHIATPTLSELTFYSSGNLTFENQFQSDQLYVNLWESSGDLNLNVATTDLELKSHTGTGTITCRGTSKKYVAYMGGNGFVDSKDLICEEVLAVNENTGNLIVNAQNKLQADIRSSGNVEYYGNPTIELNDTGKGELIKK